MAAVLGIAAIIMVLQPDQQERAETWKKHQQQVPQMSCTELKDHITKSITAEEGKYFFVNKAKELYEWKCEK